MPGSHATVQLKGSSRTFEARVTAVRGAGARFSYPDLAAEPPLVPEGQLRVLVALDPADLDAPETGASFWDVGRTAEVRFSRSLLADLRLFGLGAGSRPVPITVADTAQADHR